MWLVLVALVCGLGLWLGRAKIKVRKNSLQIYQGMLQYRQLVGEELPVGNHIIPKGNQVTPKGNQVMAQGIQLLLVQVITIRSMLTAEMIFLMAKQAMIISKVVQAMILTCLVKATAVILFLKIIIMIRML